ncbi:pirin family protein [Achromobacter xylosoxidans]|uniref:Pirin family protein n=1 Tax=Alcaligenes xylosoxydans xylosoxydans TaxID=85698 RepID=A0A0X8P493_ALCXX|nr:pirin family protein [Achromobacter xylosoxidans]AMG39595.1 pirin family protein [Achromobacter xylosoxidans]
MTIRLSPPVARPFEPAGDACSIRQFRHTDFPLGMSPLVLVDHFVMTGPTFAPHPHAGMSAVTLLLEDSRGVMRSRDSVHNDHEIRAGDLHWTLAGRGIVHTQQPVGEARLNGLQLFVNLPQRLKALPPATSLLRAWEMPVLQSDAGRVRVAAGHYDGWDAPLETPEPLLILDGWLRPGASRLVRLPAGWNAWLYAAQGELGVRARHQTTPPRASPDAIPAEPSPAPVAAFRSPGRTRIACKPVADPDFAVLPPGAALAASADSEGLLQLIASGAPVHFILVAGPAIDEPVIQRGPFVMADARALTRAMAAYEAGEFGQLRQESGVPG